MVLDTLRRAHLAIQNGIGKARPLRFVLLAGMASLAIGASAPQDQDATRQEKHATRLRAQGYAPKAARVEGAALVDRAEKGAVLWESEQGEALLLYRAKDTDRPIAVVASQVIVTLEAGAPPIDTARLQAAGLDILDRSADGRILLVRATAATRLAPADVLALFTRTTGVRPVGAEGNQVGLFDDAQDRQYERLTQPWPHRNRGSSSSKADADIDGNEALARYPLSIPPSNAVRIPVVMVIDTGMDTMHPALAGVLWRNSAETAGDGVDNDGNGYRDDVNGWNFADNNGLVFDPNGHGTHVAGIIAANPDTNSGAVRGSAPGARLMIGKVSPAPQMMQVIKAIGYATDKQASVVSMSLSFTANSPTLNQALLAYEASGGIAVASADNDGKDLREAPVYPCMFGTVVCVGASDMNDAMASFSNYGASFGALGQPGVAILAPGVAIRSTWPGGMYKDLDGTSMAAPFVAAAMAGTWRLYPTATHSEIRNRVLQTSDRIATLDVSKVEEGRRLNLYQAFYARNPRREFATDGYCNQVVFDPTTNQQHPRHTNYPFANSGEPAIDGASFAGAYTICTVAQLAAIQGIHLNRFFELKTNLRWRSDITGAWQRAVGDAVSPAGQFNGVFDGGGFTIEGFDQGVRANSGLFARIGARGHVTNLRFVGAKVRANGVAGVVATTMEGGSIVNVQVDGSIDAGSGGGLVGGMTGGEIRDSYFEGTIDTRAGGGGIVGAANGEGALLRNVYFSGTINTPFQAGGIAGTLGYKARIERSHANLLVPRPASGTRKIAGGLVGYLLCRGTIADSYAEGDIAADEMAGGIAGRITNGDIVRSYASVFFSSDLATTGGAVGQVADGLRGDNGRYMCTESEVKPPVTTRLDDFFDSFQGGTGVGTPKSPQALRTLATFAGWSNDIWDMAAGAAPRIKALPRSTRSDY